MLMICDPAAPAMIEDAVLRRGQFTFGLWSRKLGLQLLSYLDPSALDVQTLRKNDDLGIFKSMLESVGVWPRHRMPW